MPFLHFLRICCHRRPFFICSYPRIANDAVASTDRQNYKLQEKSHGNKNLFLFIYFDIPLITNIRIASRHTRFNDINNIDINNINTFRDIMLHP